MSHSGRRATSASLAESKKEMPVPRRRRATPTAARLGRLPRRPDLTIEGGIRPLSVYMRDGERVVQPLVALWMESEVGVIRSYRILLPDAAPDVGTATAVEALVEALASPATLAGIPGVFGEPGLPAVVRVDDPVLGEAVRSLLEPVNVPVETVPSLEHLDEVSASLDTSLGGEPGAPPPEPFAWDISVDLLLPLYEASAAYARRAPWEYMDDTPPIAVSLGDAGPQRNTRTLYGCVMGAAGMLQGIAFYYSLAQLERAMDTGETLYEGDELLEGDVDEAMPQLIAELRRSGIPVDEIPPDVLREAMMELAGTLASGELPPMQNALAVYFDVEDENDPTYLAWIGERGLPLASRNAVPSFVRTRSRGDPRLPNAREVRALTVALQAVNGFLSRFRRQLDTLIIPSEVLATHVKIPDGRSIEVRWPGDE